MCLLNKILTLSDEYCLYNNDLKVKKYYLFNIVEGSIFTLNEVSYDMLSLFDGKKTTEGIISDLQSIYDVDKNELEEDFNKLLAKWIDKKILIERTNNGREKI